MSGVSRVEFKMTNLCRTSSCVCALLLDSNHRFIEAMFIDSSSVQFRPPLGGPFVWTIERLQAAKTWPS
jgi:hypothetical protein